MSRCRAALLVAPLALVGVVLAGPRVPGAPDAPGVVELPDGDLEALAASLADAEARVPDLVPGTEKHIEWVDPVAPSSTDHALVYLHGFSATRKETEPLPQKVSAALGANLFLTRLTGHGRGGEAMAEGSVAGWIRDGEEALAVGDRISREGVILMGTSTGASLALWLALRSPRRDRIAALLLISPNLGVPDPRARMLLWPWGEQLARWVVGPEHRWEPANEAQARYWTTRYPVGALLPMQALVREVRALPLEALDIPVFVAYSPDDTVVDPARILAAYRRLEARPRELWRAPVRPGHPGDAHVLAGDILAPDLTDDLAAAMIRFLALGDILPGEGP